MKEYSSLDQVGKELVKKINPIANKNNISLIYAFNGIGKTRLSSLIDKIINKKDNIEEDEDYRFKVISYNSYFEDLFTWDNDNHILKFNSKNHIIQFINDQGLDNKIIDNFQKLTRTKIFPKFNIELGQVIFSFNPGDDRNEENIKISRGEESLFIWSVFFTVIEEIINILNENIEDRETDLFNDLRMIIVDDPVSSIDDPKIISMAIELITLINENKNQDLGFFISSHHALFFNVLFNEFYRNKKVKLSASLLSKNDYNYILESQDDTPFSYHISIKNQIENSIQNNSIKKYHFNLFRGLLEKTANFLGYKNWSDLLTKENKTQMTRLLNLYSHGKLSELESDQFPQEDKDIFEKIFRAFLISFNWQSDLLNHDQCSK